jgi:hypothetical protein
VGDRQETNDLAYLGTSSEDGEISRKRQAVRIARYKPCFGMHVSECLVCESIGFDKLSMGFAIDCDCLIMKWHNSAFSKEKLCFSVRRRLSILTSRLAVGLGIFLTIMIVSAAVCGAVPQSVTHNITICVPAVDVVRLSCPGVHATLQARNDNTGFVQHVLEAGDLRWITNDSPREVTVNAQCIPNGLTLEVLKSLSPANKWLELGASHVLLIDDASCHPGTSLPREFSIFYRILATLEVRPDTYEIVVIYTLTV